MRLVLDSREHGDSSLAKTVLVAAQQEVKSVARIMREVARTDPVLQKPERADERADELERAKRAGQLAKDLRDFIRSEFGGAE